MVTEWTINTGGVPLLDAIFGTDRTSYLQDWRLRSKSYALGMYAGDGISLVQGTVSLVGAGMFFIGGNLFGVGGTPFTGGASLTLCPVTTAVTVAVAAEASTMVVSAVKNMGEGHRWDPELEGEASSTKPKFKWEGKDFSRLGENYTPKQLIEQLEQQGWVKTIEQGGNKSGPATILTNPTTGEKVRIHTSPSNGKPYFRVQNKGGNYLDDTGQFPSNATKQELRDLTHFYFE